jgi:hypothetical protein
MGEICATAAPNGHRRTRAKEVQVMLKFERDSDWPLKLTFATVISDRISASITYQIDWTDYMPDLSQHPDFASGSLYCQEQMGRFSNSPSTMDLSDFQPLVNAEAKQSDLETAEDGAISRLRPIQDGLELWGIHRSSGDTGSGGPAPG